MEILAGIAGGIVSGLGMGGGTVLIIFLSLFWEFFVLFYVEIHEIFSKSQVLQCPSTHFAKFLQGVTVY